MSAARRPPPTPPRPDHRRQPRGGFGWLEAELLHEGWLADLGPHAAAVLVLLAIAADRRGASFFSRDRMAQALGMTRADVDQALACLVSAQLVELRPWRQGGADGVWQLVPVPRRGGHQRAGKTLSAAELLRLLGFLPPKTSDRRISPETDRR